MKEGIVTEKEAGARISIVIVKRVTNALEIIGGRVVVPKGALVVVIIGIRAQRDNIQKKSRNLAVIVLQVNILAQPDRDPVQSARLVSLPTEIQITDAPIAPQARHQTKMPQVVTTAQQARHQAQVLVRVIVATAESTA